MANKKRRRNTSNCAATPVSINSSQDPVSYAYVQQMMRQQTANDCDTLVREISERLAALSGKVQSLRYS